MFHQALLNENCKHFDILHPFLHVSIFVFGPSYNATILYVLPYSVVVKGVVFHSACFCMLVVL